MCHGNKQMSPFLAPCDNRLEAQSGWFVGDSLLAGTLPTQRVHYHWISYTRLLLTHLTTLMKDHPPPLLCQDSKRPPLCDSSSLHCGLWSWQNTLKSMLLILKVHYFCRFISVLTLLKQKLRSLGHMHICFLSPPFTARLCPFLLHL